MQKYNKNLMYISFAIYIMLLIWVIMFKWTNYIAVQECIVSFRKLTLTQRFIECKQSFFGFDFTDMVLNALLYLPMGFYLALLVQKKHFIFLIGLASSLFFEIFQFFTCIGMFNIFDIIGNTLGCVIGYILFLLIKRLINRRFIDTLNIVVILLFTPVCIYAIYMTIINFDYYI